MEEKRVRAMNTNKITNTKIGDDIHFYVNGTEDRGIVVKMNNDYVTVFKESTQAYDDIHINDTFFIKDILVNKEWNKMDDIERYDALKKIHAPSPRFISKVWEDLPKDIKELLQKNNAIETSHKEGKDDDMNNVNTREFDKALNNRGRPNPKNVEGKVTGETEESAGGVKGTTDSKQTDSGEMAESEDKYSKNSEQIVNHGLPEAFTTIDEKKLGAGSKGDKNVTGQNYLTEGGGGIGAGEHKLSGQSLADQQTANFDKRQGRQQARAQQAKDKPKTDKKVTAGMKKLKAWQLWLAKREQQVLKDSVTGEQSTSGRPKGELSQTRSGQSETESLRGGVFGIRSGDDPKNRGGTKIHFDPRPSGSSSQPAGDKKEKPKGTAASVLDTRWAGEQEEGFNEKVRPSSGTGAPKGTTKKAWEEWLEYQKSNTERSIHGNAGREPNSGVNTNTGFDASEDYEGFSHSGLRPEQFKHEKVKPKVTTKERINIGTTNPSKPSAGTGDGGNPYDTKTGNKDVKGRAVAGKDKK